MKKSYHIVNHPIDFVVTWLDSSDEVWQKEYFKYKGEYSTGDQSESRFRNWDFFRFWFRAVEKYAPWVNNIYLVTNGTYPKWINNHNPKLVLVNHKDYIPVQFLPTFNSCTIELHMHRIPGLSEHFVYFNDDCFINGHIDPDYYFRKGLPCDNNKETILNTPIYDKDFKFGIYPSLLTNIGVINANFNRWITVKSSLKKWFGPHLGIQGILTSVMLGRQRRFVGFNWRHLEQPFLKSIFEEAWEKSNDILEKSCTRFREEITINPYFFRYWQFASNRFYPMKFNRSKQFRVRRYKAQAIVDAINNEQIKSVCINDTTFCSHEDYLYLKDLFIQAFEKKFPHKSAFEL